MIHVEVRTARNGVGLFASERVEAGETIIRIPGHVVRHEVVWKRGGKFADNCFRFGPETYLDPAEGFGAYINHSCVPNAGIRKKHNQLFLFAARAIGAAREILIDYSTILGDDDIWTMRCNCGRRACRGRIRRFGTLPLALRRNYVRKGLVPGYILATLDAPEELL
jgi:SET domain-containing protein